MKKFIFGIVLLFGIFWFSACENEGKEMPPPEQNDEMFVIVSMQEINTSAGKTNVYVVYDKNTKVQYVIVFKYQGGTSVIVMVDENGKPLLYGE